MSALAPIADMCSATWYVRFVPIADIGYWSLDHLVGPEEDGLWDSNIEGLRRLRIYDQFELRRPFNRQGSRFGTLDDAINVVSKPTVGLCEPRSVGTKGATLREYCPPGYHRHPAAHREFNNSLPVLNCKTISKDRNCLDGCFRNPGKSAIELTGVSGRKIIGQQP